MLQRGKNLSIVLSKTILEKSSTAELSAINFELLLQVKKKMAGKRTKLMFILGFFAWGSHVIMSAFSALIPSKEIRQSADWYVNSLLYPWLSLAFKLFLGTGYFKNLKSLMEGFPVENNLLRNVGMKLVKSASFGSFPSKKLMELSSSSRSRHFQHIMAMEFLPHEWDYIFEGQEN
ncbi:MAG TPA: hypothetical protein VNJ01_14580 [Bacteriovoracaceae bacterium]|nr:hypothetical protein [Bacteriovoracaceae bacterium]